MKFSKVNNARQRMRIQFLRLTKAELQFVLGKELIACESAVSSFLTILKTVGGPNEKMRSENFLPRIKVYPDLSEEQEQTLWRVAKLQVGGKIRERTYNVIAFGLYHKALTVTANKGAIEAAKMQVRHHRLENRFYGNVLILFTCFSGYQHTIDRP